MPSDCSELGMILCMIRFINATQLAARDSQWLEARRFHICRPSPEHILEGLSLLHRLSNTPTALRMTVCTVSCSRCALAFSQPIAQYVPSRSFKHRHSQGQLHVRLHQPSALAYVSYEYFVLVQLTQESKRIYHRLWCSPLLAFNDRLSWWKPQSWEGWNRQVLSYHNFE